jgi:uncharacterized protein YbcI
MTLEDQPTRVEDASSEAASNHRASQLLQVSRAMVRIYKEQFGRGPERVRSHYAGPDAIVCFLENTLTPVERSLDALGEKQRLRDMRMLFQYAAENEFRSAIEQITGRKVIAFVSGIDTTADVASELFTFQPLNLDDASEPASFRETDASS